MLTAAFGCTTTEFVVMVVVMVTASLLFVFVVGCLFVVCGSNLKKWTLFSQSERSSETSNK